RIVENQYIEEMTDEGARALNLSEEELAERIEEFTQIATERLEELQEEEEEDIEEEEFDEDEDFEDEDEDDLDIKEMMDRVQEAFGITSIALSYTDAL